MFTFDGRLLTTQIKRAPRRIEVEGEVEDGLSYEVSLYSRGFPFDIERQKAKREGPFLLVEHCRDGLRVLEAATLIDLFDEAVDPKNHLMAQEEFLAGLFAEVGVHVKVECRCAKDHELVTTMSGA